jgi:hypothetical protein
MPKIERTEMPFQGFRQAKTAMLIMVNGALLGSCSIISGREMASLPSQPAEIGSPTAAVTIVLPEDAYQGMPGRASGANPATEAQLEWVETYALYLPPGLRHQLVSRVDDCRFTARQACQIVSATQSAGSGS